MTKRKSIFTVNSGSQPRDSRQRFSKAAGKRSAARNVPLPAGLKVGRSGPSRLSRLSSEELAGRLVELEDEIERQEIELGTFKKPPCQPLPPNNTVAMVQLARATTTLNCMVLVEIVTELTADPTKKLPTKEVIAGLLSKKLGREVSPATLEDSPYKEALLGRLVKPPANPVYDSFEERVRRHLRSKRRLLIFWILQKEKKVKDLEVLCGIARCAWAAQLEPISPTPF